MTVGAVLTDIEGTTGSIAFVHDELFPYARARLHSFLAAHEAEPAVARLIDDVARDVGQFRLTTEEAAGILTRWIDEDSKATPLKALQGMIWEAGFRDGTLRGHVYPDAVAALRRWRAGRIALYVFSSGSIAAQKLLFGHSLEGDLTPLFSGYFDTTSGAKGDPAAYRNICGALGREPGSILFVTDSATEIAAAHAAGLRTAWMVRPDNPPHSGPRPPADVTVRDFDRIDLSAL